MDFREVLNHVNSDLNESTDYEKAVKKVDEAVIGKKVQIHPSLTTDPYDKRGQYGTVIKIEGDILHVKFEDGTVGKYMEDAVKESVKISEIVVPSGNEIPEEILQDVYAAKTPSMSWKEVVGMLLDDRQYRQWFKEEYSGNEFDLRQDLEVAYKLMNESSDNLEPEEVQFSESKVNEEGPMGATTPNPPLPEPEEEQTPAEPGQDEDMAPEEEKKEEEVQPEDAKEYLGNTGSEDYFYLIKEPNEENGIKSLAIVDANEEVVLDAVENGLDVNDVAGLIAMAIKELELSNISTEIITKYLIPDEKEEVIVDDPTKPESGDEQQQKAEETPDEDNPIAPDRMRRESVDEKNSYEKGEATIKGKKYYATGKTGKNNKTGLDSKELSTGEGDADIMWIDSENNVNDNFRESVEEAKSKLQKYQQSLMKKYGPGWSKALKADEKEKMEELRKMKESVDVTNNLKCPNCKTSLHLVNDTLYKGASESINEAFKTWLVELIIGTSAEVDTGKIKSIIKTSLEKLDARVQIRKVEPIVESVKEYTQAPSVDDIAFYIPKPGATTIVLELDGQKISVPKDEFKNAITMEDFQETAKTVWQKYVKEVVEPVSEGLDNDLKWFVKSFVKTTYQKLQSKYKGYDVKTMLNDIGKYLETMYNQQDANMLIGESKRASLLAQFKKAFPGCWVKDGRDFDGGSAVLWSGEGSNFKKKYKIPGGGVEEFNIPMFDIYSNSSEYEFGVHQDVIAWADKNKLYWEAYDAGTFMAYSDSNLSEKKINKLKNKFGVKEITIKELKVNKLKNKFKINEVNIYSILRNIVEEVKSLIINDKYSIDKLKTFVIDEIKKHNIKEKDKNRMLSDIARQKDNNGLIAYLYNAILKYEGEGVIRPGEARMRKLKAKYIKEQDEIRKPLPDKSPQVDPEMAPEDEEEIEGEDLTGVEVSPEDMPAEKQPVQSQEVDSPETAKADIEMQYPEEPLTSTALAYADSVVHDPQIYGAIRDLNWQGVYTNSDTFLKQVKIVGKYNNFNSETAKKLVDKFGDSAKYKLGREKSPVLYITVRDDSKQHSIEAIKDISGAQEVIATGNPGEIRVWWN